MIKKILIIFFLLIGSEAKSSEYIENHYTETQIYAQKFYEIAMNVSTKEFIFNEPLSKEKITKNAFNFIEEMQIILKTERGSFKIQEVFTTPFTTDLGKYDFIHDYFFGEYAAPDITLFEKILSFVDNIDEYIDSNTGQTLLMRFANDYLNGLNRSAFVEMLLKKGASLTKQDKRGLDAFIIALYADNKPIITLFQNHIKDHSSLELSPFTQKALAVYYGETVDVNTEENIIHRILYRIANQAQNKNMVRKFEEKSSIIKQIKKTIKTYSEKNPTLFSKTENWLFEPFWSYNIIELEEYAKKIYQQLKPHFIYPEQLSEEKGITYLTLNDNEKIKLYPKGPNVGRILGRDYLEQQIKRLENTQLAVPRKFILKKEGPPFITFKVPSSSNSQAQSVRGGDRTDNPMNIEMHGVEIYAEYIPDKGEGLIESNASAQKAGASSLGIQDWGAKNAIISMNDSKIYLIDTDTDKNFIPYYFSASNKNLNQDLKTIKNIKETMFNPQIQFISISLEEVK